MTKTATNTPTPWHIGVKQADQIVYDEKGWAICNCTVYHGKESAEPKHNSRHIVRCVNAHDRLVAALRELSSATEHYTLTNKPAHLAIVRDRIKDARALLAEIDKGECARP